MTGTAASVYAKVVTTLGSRLRSRAMVTIAALLGVAGLVLWPVAALPVAEADQGSGTLPLAQSAGLSAEIAPAAPATPSATSAPTKAAPSAPTSKEKPSNQVTVSIDAMAPEVLHSDQDLNLTGTITNGTAQTITGADLVTRVQRSTEATSRGLSKWLTGTDESGLSDPFTVPLGHDLQPGGVSQFSITIPADELPLDSTDQWGPRGVSVALATQDVSLAQDRSILVWDSGSSVAPVRMTVFLPVTASAQEMAVLSAPHTQERTEALSRIHNRVQGLVSMAGDGVVVAVDPALIEALGVTTDSLEQAARNSSSQPSTPDASPQAPQSADSSASSAPTTPSTPAPSASAAPSPQAGGNATASPSGKAPQASNEVIQLSAALARAIHTDSLVALPWGDSDTAALAHLQQTSLIETAARRTQESAIVKVGAPTSVSWLASSVADATTVNALAQPDSTIIASPESLSPSDDLTYTPSGLGASGNHAVLIPEQSLSEALTGEDAKPTASDQGDSTAQSAQASALDTRQLLRSDSAILARQAPALERDIVVAMPRRAASAVQSSVVRERVAALRSVPWTQSQSFSTLQEHAQQEVSAVAEGTSRIDRSEMPDTVIDTNELSADTLAAAGRTATTLQSISSVLSEPAALLGDYTNLEAVVSSASWRSDPKTRSAQIPNAEAAGAGVTSSLAAVPSSTINVISSEAQLPVRITSSLNQDVTVQVYLVSNNKRLQVPRTTTVRVPAHQQAKVTVPIQAVGSGDVALTVQVLAADGTTVGTPTTVNMRVRADWEGRGTGVIVGVLVAIVVTGTVRTVRRGRRTAVAPAAQETA
ncbi:DUF6049 family protein [Actinomyces oris]|uniref:DUF6049 family protein n=1 Tax=Actinomyces oris TaxID=544580 RepID=UPI0028E5A672|nr:DUF6049 family protein [Actinomyces oris]